MEKYVKSSEQKSRSLGRCSNTQNRKGDAFWIRLLMKISGFIPLFCL